MTYTELSKIKTTGFTTNHVIDDVVNNGRACYTKAAFKTAVVSESDIEKIMFWARKENCPLYFAAQASFHGVPLESLLTKSEMHSLDGIWTISRRWPDESR